MASSITTDELRTAEKQDICIIDVRRKADYDKSPETIEGAVWHDPEKVEEWSKDLPKDKKIVFYCVKGGQVSQSISEKAQQENFNACYLEGGINKFTEK